MASYPKTFTANNFIQQEDGRYMATILGTTHGLGIAFGVTRVQKRRTDMTWENVIPCYEVTQDGDFKLYVEETGIYRVYLSED